MQIYAIALMALFFSIPVLASDLETSMNLKTGRYTFKLKMTACDIKLIPEVDGNTIVIGHKDSKNYAHYRDMTKTLTSSYQTIDSLSRIDYRIKDRRFSYHLLRTVRYVSSGPEDALKFMNAERVQLITALMQIKGEFAFPVHVYSDIEIYGLTSPEDRNKLLQLGITQETEQLKTAFEKRSPVSASPSDSMEEDSFIPSDFFNFGDAEIEQDESEKPANTHKEGQME